MKKVYLYAYDKVNLGDDLFIRTITNRYPDVQFYLESDITNKTVFSDVKNLQILDKNSWKIRVLNKIRPSLVARYRESWKKKCDAVVYIGGSIFMEYPTWKDIVNWWDYQSKTYSFYVLGANFGPYKTEEYRKEMERVFQKIKDVCFRDEYSKDLFSNVKNVRYAPDILLSYPMKKVKNKKNQVLFSVVDDKKGKVKNREVYYESMACMVKGYIEDGYEVVLTSFCKEEGDEDAVKEMGNLLIEYKDRIHDCFYNGENYQEVLDEIASSTYVVATRFHAVILSMVVDVPVFPILYSDKTKHILEDMKFEGVYGDLRQITSLTYDNSIKNMEYVVDVNEQKRNGQKHFEKLDILLEK